ncbi:hypothetical protein IAQ61_006403 [Plenodomus lingam]|uniref:uncharacterized protein n=1 Tax=Leptosphaeria maculans TaxID=5022 RepID=UPI00331D1C13|nr:hypothetical protein IAQ61_006403 [Plenodomus lingam]
MNYWRFQQTNFGLSQCFRTDRRGISPQSATTSGPRISVKIGLFICGINTSKQYIKVARADDEFPLGNICLRKGQDERMNSHLPVINDMLEMHKEQRGSTEGRPRHDASTLWYPKTCRAKKLP